MPIKSEAQQKAMYAAAAGKSTLGIPKKVGKEFVAADKGKKFLRGGEMKHDDLKEDKKLIKKAFKMHDDQEHKGEHTNLSKLCKGGKAMKKGGSIKEARMEPATMANDVEKGSNKLTKHGESAVQKRGHTKGHNLGDAGKTVKPKDIKPMRKGGYAKVADGIAQRGKTRGKLY